MRIQEFLEIIIDCYDFSKACAIIKEPNFNGGWEVWLQVELAMTILSGDSNNRFAREVRYPGTNQRCDFYLERGNRSDPTYIELKCQYSENDLNTTGDVIDRFCNDIQKQKSPSLCNYPGFCLAVVYCDKDTLAEILQVELNFSVSSAFVMDCIANEIVTFQEFPSDNTGDDKQIYVLGVSP